MTRKHAVGAMLFAIALFAGGPSATLGQTIEIPQSIASGHDALYARMKAATRAEGEVGEAARAAMEVLGPHFEKEEAYALPQLGVVAALVGAPLAPDAGSLEPGQREDLIERTERLRAELPQMLEEHERIASALEELRRKAEAAGDNDLARLAEEIGDHARMEEEVLYPAALLVGDHARLRGDPSR